MKAMKHYLDLAPASARAHRSQNRTTLACIALAVFLVTAIFSMADMEIRNEQQDIIRRYGSWHAAFAGLDGDQAAVLAARPEVADAVQYTVYAYADSGDYRVDGVAADVLGADGERLAALMPMLGLVAGRWPDAPGELAASEGLGAALGQAVVLQTPQGDSTMTVTGLIAEETGAAPVVLLPAGGAGQGAVLLIRFRPFCRIEAAIETIQGGLGLPDTAVGRNQELLWASLQGSGNYVQGLYQIAALLFVLVLTAGVLMIAGTLNSSVANRTRFFGLLRCLGATPRQVMRYVRREALQWCATAIPAGAMFGIAATWLLCALLRGLAPAQFAFLPVGAVSPVGLVCGALTGLLTVLLASRAPAKRAARVSPLAALSGNDGAGQANGRLRLPAGRRIVAVLGLHHAAGSKKNLLLVSGSFAFSIVLFLGFSAMMDFFGHAIQKKAYGTYRGMQALVYGFLAIIALIAVLNVINQLAMSAAARTRQYGAMRAVGMGMGQLGRMLAAEAMAYTLGGCALGMALGLPLHCLVYTTLVTSKWGDAWRLPWGPLAVILVLVCAAAALAVRGPVRRLRAMTIVETIGR